MNVGIIGSGGREHALCIGIKNSKNVKKIYCIPGNAGTASIATNIEIDLNNFSEIKNFIISKNIDFVLVGPEKPLVDGIVDFLKDINVKVFGPNKAASQLEGSKIFTKRLCHKFNIPTANFGIFQNIKDSKKFLESSRYPVVIKADGLASGKGVYICENLNDALIATDEIFEGKFGIAKHLLIEEFLEGEEMSFFVISDGNTIQCFNTAQDHKRVLEGDKGKNTGGMGAYSPSRLINENLEKKIINKIIKPTLMGLAELNCEYKGFLYTGLMIVNNEPYLIEYNVRMGDPECQTILPTLNIDLFDVLISCCEGKLNQININFSKSKSICVVLCSKGYPEKFENNIKIKDLEQINLLENQNIFHAGTLKTKTGIVSNGGRVLNFVSTSDNFSKSREEAINLIKKLNWENGYFRRDIGHKVI